MSVLKMLYIQSLNTCSVHAIWYVYCRKYFVKYRPGHLRLYTSIRVYVYAYVCSHRVDIHNQVINIAIAISD